MRARVTGANGHSGNQVLRPEGPPERSELVASLHVLAHVAQADGSVARDEKSVLDAAGAAEMGMSPTELAAGTTDLDDELRRIVSPTMRTRTLTEAVALANVDGRCSDDEAAVLLRIQRAFGAADLDLSSAGAEWKGRGATLRAALAEATNSYLHDVNDASRRGALTQDWYDQQVAELGRRKRELQREFLSPAVAAKP